MTSRPRADFDGAATIGPPLAVTYADIVSVGHPPKWDPVTETPWTVFRRDRTWHQTWFDDPVSIALKTALAAQFRCAGVGVWELGMSGGDPKITAALLGGSPPVKLPLASPLTSPILAQLASSASAVSRAIRRTSRDLRRDAWLAWMTPLAAALSIRFTASRRRSAESSAPASAATRAFFVRVFNSERTALFLRRRRSF